jgi:hypothetical protein
MSKCGVKKESVPDTLNVIYESPDLSGGRWSEKIKDEQKLTASQSALCVQLVILSICNLLLPASSVKSPLSPGRDRCQLKRIGESQLPSIPRIQAPAGREKAKASDHI